MASKKPAEIGWVRWWSGQRFETRCKGFSEASIALLSALCCFKTSVTGGNHEHVPAAALGYIRSGSNGPWNDVGHVVRAGRCTWKEPGAFDHANARVAAIARMLARVSDIIRSDSSGQRASRQALQYW